MRCRWKGILNCQRIWFGFAGYCVMECVGSWDGREEEGGRGWEFYLPNVHAVGHGILDT